MGLMSSTPMVALVIAGVMFYGFTTCNFFVFTIVAILAQLAVMLNLKVVLDQPTLLNGAILLSSMCIIGCAARIETLYKTVRKSPELKISTRKSFWLAISAIASIAIVMVTFVLAGSDSSSLVLLSVSGWALIPLHVLLLVAKENYEASIQLNFSEKTVGKAHL